jgi:citrate lyase subunit beta/citryl-CoA lyase
MGIPQAQLGESDSRYPGHQWHWVMAQIAVHAKAAGAQAIDGPYADFSDEVGFKESALRARLLGFDGKWCIHPNQIPWANEAFAPTEAEVSDAEAMLVAYAASLAHGKGAAAFEGRLIDEASRKLAEATLQRARAAGLGEDVPS